MEITPAQLVEQVCTILAVGIPIWAWLIWRTRMGIPLLSHEPRRAVPWEASDLLIVLVIYILAAICFTALGQGLAGLRLSDLQQGGTRELLVNIVGDGVARVATLFLAVAILKRRDQATAADLGFSRSKAAFDVICGTIAFVALAPLVYAVQVVSEAAITQYSHPLITTVKLHRDPFTWITVTISAVVIAPVAEEFFFRGLLQGWLEKMELTYCKKNLWPQDISLPEEDVFNAGHAVAGKPPAGRGLLNLPLGTVPIVYSSALFAVTHLGQGAAQLPLFVLALGLGFLYQRTHRLLPSITVHFLLNGLTMVMLFAFP